jgi:N-acetylglucosamine-6-sulfatase
MTPEAPPAGDGQHRAGLAAALAIAALVLGLVVWPHAHVRANRPPNVVVILTDDQPNDSIPNPDAIMPYLQARVLDPNDHWVVFDHAYVNTPLCCPSRASMLTGQFSHHTGVLDNESGQNLDESSTIATWLHAAGYHTGLIGKYLNHYPFGGPGYVPPGWDVWAARHHGPVTRLYYGYTLIEQDRAVQYGRAGTDYSTDVLARKAVTFIREAPSDRPYFLWFAPMAPHPPATPAPGDVGAFAGLPLPVSPSFGEADVSDKPEWVQELPEIDAASRAATRADHRRSYETLLGVDDAIRNIVAAIRARGELRDTVLIFTTDNGLAFGEHRWRRKSCPYAVCVHVPLMIRMPGVEHRTEPAVVSEVDLAPTILELARARPVTPFDGVSLVSLLRTGSREGLSGELYAEFAGSDTIPPWWEIRTRRFAFVELATGERELYDLRDDPDELVNVVRVRAFDDEIARLTRTLEAYRSA